MPKSTKDEKRFMRFQHLLENLQRQTNELERLAITVAADRRTKAPPDTPVERVVVPRKR